MNQPFNQVKLKTYQTELVKTTQTKAELKTELINRNNVLYNEESGVSEIGQNVKKYVKRL